MIATMPSKASPVLTNYIVLTYKINPGATQVHAIYNIVSVLADRGDTIVVDEFAYVHVTECILVPKGLKLLPVSDAIGAVGARVGVEGDVRGTDIWLRGNV